MENKDSKLEKVLVIDDEGDLSELVEIALRNDFVSEVVFDGREALVKLQDFKPKLIITDVYLPTAGGLDFIDEIRKLCPAPIIVVSGTRLPRKLSFYQSKGIAAIMIKPFTLKDLKAAIQKALASYPQFI